MRGRPAIRMTRTGTSNNPFISWFNGATRQGYMGWGTPGNAFQLNMEANNDLSLVASLTTISKDLYLNHGTSRSIAFSTAGVAAPSAGSAGMRLQLYGTTPNVMATSDYALGVESNNMWFNTASGFKWYAGAVNRMILDTSGNLTAVAFLYSSDKRLKSDIVPLTGGLGDRPRHWPRDCRPSTTSRRQTSARYPASFTLQ
jgi:hypothetical protein